MSNNLNWLRFIYAWDFQLTKFNLSSRLQDFYAHGGKPFCVQFNSFLDHAFPNSNLWAGKIKSVQMSGQEILQILRYNVPQAVAQADRAFSIENNLAKYEAIIFINTWSQLLSTQQAGLIAYDFHLKNKIYAKNFVIPEVIWQSGKQAGHNWLDELNVNQQTIYVERDQIRSLYMAFDGKTTTF
jgi:hypothetical protein